MRELAAILWGAARLQPAALGKWKARWGLGAGLVLLVAVSLASGAASAASWADAGLHRAAPWVTRADLIETMDWWFSRSPLPLDAQHELTRDAVAWLDLQTELDGLPRPLGREAGYVVQGLQRTFAAPYLRLAAWLPYSLVVLALARALGGRAGLPEMLGTTALYVVPHLLDPLGALLGLGPLVGVVTFAWGAAIYARAVGVANDLDGVRTAIAVLMPALAAVTLAAIVASMAIVLRS